MSPTHLQTARSQSKVDSAAIEKLLRGPEQLALRNKVLPVLANDPIFDKTRKPFLNHAQGIIDSLKVCKRLLELRDQHNWTREEYVMALLSLEETVPLAMSENAFMTVIDSQGSPEQKAHWLPRCRSYEIIGCYAQTEIAHGSNVQGLQTTARYDAQTKEFVINTPMAEDAKFWIGAMGVTANHALVQAILQVPDSFQPSGYRSVGPHLFIVPIRDQITHKPLPGITVGDIGPKAYGGFRVLDNGYLHLNSVRVPRDYMLMAHSKVSPNGEFQPAKHDKLSYGSMVYLRAGIPATQGWSLARAVTIAIRYCISRTQFSTSPGTPENSVIDYASTRHRLYPLLATSYAYIFAGKELLNSYYDMMDSLAKGDVSKLAEVHALSTALKTKSSWDCVAGMEEARKAMGGHGYSHLSGVAAIFAQQTPAQTFEGDNYVISQQIARALIKAVMLLKQHPQAPLPGSFSYLHQVLSPSPFTTSPDNWSNPSQQIQALQKCAAKIINDLAVVLAKNPRTPWTDLSWTSARLAAAHADIFVVDSFQKAVQAHGNPDLRKLGELYSLTTLVKAIPELVEAGVDTAGLRQAQEAAVGAISKEAAVGLTDAFGWLDWELPGVLGKKDGRIYEEMTRVVEEWDINKGEYGPQLREAALALTGHESAKTAKSKL
ncbi:acyl-CoA oxidase [Ascodesmis nigricans]|uniref:Acyl-coenzyme A oxidase n=1 Tax=Ascodesmis nigricans TaxID=341454 RepID=A0A4S2N2C5_9PEZI|nr:acyl-CoA oxidase [Ascodesmis nigricans]